MTMTNLELSALFLGITMVPAGRGSTYRVAEVPV